LFCAVPITADVSAPTVSAKKLDSVQEEEAPVSKSGDYDDAHEELGNCHFIFVLFILLKQLINLYIAFFIHLN
jgi:hypothetical protein